MIHAECPFCKGSPRRCEVVISISGRHYVLCTRCKARGPEGYSVDQAEKGWNEPRTGVTLDDIFNDLWNKAGG